MTNPPSRRRAGHGEMDALLPAVGVVGRHFPTCRAARSVQSAVKEKILPWQARFQRAQFAPAGIGRWPAPEFGGGCRQSRRGGLLFRAGGSIFPPKKMGVHPRLSSGHLEASRASLGPV